MAEEQPLNENHDNDTHMTNLNANPPVEPNKDDLEEHQYECAKASYVTALELWKAEVALVEGATAQVLSE